MERYKIEMRKQTQKFDKTLTLNVFSIRSDSWLKKGRWYNTAALLIRMDTSGTPTFLINLAASRTSTLFDTSTAKP